MLGPGQLWCQELPWRERWGGALSHGPATARWMACPGVGTAGGGDGAEPYSRLTLESSKLPAESRGKRNCR